MSTLDRIYIARIIIEADTPLFVGSGEVGLLSEMQVQRDHLGLPMILGTTLTGVLRNEFQEESKKGHFVEKDKKREYIPSNFEKLFGYHEENFGQGSRIRVSSAYLMFNQNECIQGLGQDKLEQVQELFTTLPTRPHVRINAKGVTDKENRGLFFNEVVYKGCRFKFEIELQGSIDDQDAWNKLMNTIKSPGFRLGMGTRKGYGALKIVDEQHAVYLIGPEAPPVDLNVGLKKELDLQKEYKQNASEDSAENKNITYKIELTPEDFFHFGNDVSDHQVNAVPATEAIIQYNENGIELLQNFTIIPASSIKGALAHRTAFHYNKRKGHFIVQDNEGYKCNTDINKIIGSQNEAVKFLFGIEANDKGDTGSRGRVIINDVFLNAENVRNDKIFNHVAIDRFTGGAVDSALFSEKVSYFIDTTSKDNHNHKINFDITLLDMNFVNDDHKEFIIAFENALLDMTTGLLPLGGMATKGHGIFKGDYNPKLIETWKA